MGTPSTTKLIKQTNGVMYEEVAIVTSAGVADANKIPALNKSGVIDATMLPPEAVAGSTSVSSVSAKCLAAIKAGEYVTLSSDGAVVIAALASATSAATQAMGFATVGGDKDAMITVALFGVNTKVAGLTPGNIFLSTTPGAGASTPPTAAGSIVQLVGVAIAPTIVRVAPQQPIVLA